MRVFTLARQVPEFDVALFIGQQSQLEDSLRFETLWADLSSKFVNLSADEVDREIEDAQRRICEYLKLNVSSLWQWTSDKFDDYQITHVFHPPSFPAFGPMKASETFPWCRQQVIAGKVVSVSSLNDLPPEAACDRDNWRHFGAMSSLIIPLSTGKGPTIGVVSFDSTMGERTWDEPTVNRLKLVAQIFANAIERKRSDEALRASEARLSLASSSADAGLWTLDMASQEFWVTEKTRELFGFPSGATVSLGQFLSYIVPDDRDRIRSAIEKSFETRQLAREEYRIVRGDGVTRWMSSRGRPYFSPSGTPLTLMGVTVDCTERKQAEEELVRAYAEIRSLKDTLQAENVALRHDLQISQGDMEIIGRSESIQHVLALSTQVAPTDSTVLILGETGTGKELVATAIHNQSSRRDRPMIRVNCAAIPSTLIESELFGREKGAYTGALTKQIGRFEAANHSTLFLDEIGELPPDVQVKLLRFLQERKIERLGAPKSISLDVRVIVATNCDLQKAIRDGRFREDLYYRLSVFPITVPPLRERKDDIPLMVRSFVDQFAKAMGKTITSMPQSDLDALQRYSWPGNVRELRNVVERAMILARESKLMIEIPTYADAPAAPRLSRLEDVERDHILRVLERTGWRVHGSGGAAEILGLKRQTLESRMAKLGIRRPGA